MCSRPELTDGDGQRAQMSGLKAGETHGEVSLAQGELSGSRGMAGDSLELWFFLSSGCCGGGRCWVLGFVGEVCTRRTVVGDHHQVGGDGE